MDPEALRERFTLHFPSYIISNFAKIETHILSEVPVETWSTYTSRDDVFAGPWDPRCYSVMIANSLSYWYHKGADHPGAVIERWAKREGLKIQ